MTADSFPAAPASREQPSIDPVAVLQALVNTTKLTAFYPDGHPTAQQRLTELDALIQDGLDAAAVLKIDIVDGTVHLDGLPFHQPVRPAVVDDLTAIGIDSIHFHRGLRSSDVQRLMELLRELMRKEGDSRPIEDLLAERDIRGVSLGRLVPLDTRWQSHQWPDGPTGPLDPNYAESLRLAQDTFEEIADGGSLNVAGVRELIDLLVFKVAGSNVAIAQILAIKEYENLTYCHSVNVAMLTLLLAKQIQLDDAVRGALVEAALLHDIGKTKVPLEIVKKPGALDQRERKLIEAHTLFGAEILVGVQGLHPLTPMIALEHHRTVKGGGYPDLGAGVIPHVLSQLVSVADVYEAVTGARTYRDPMQPEQACLLLARLAGESLNTSLVKSFINAVTFFPVGSFVRTTHDEVGIVVKITPGDAMHPVVAVTDPQFQQVTGTIDTSERDSSGAYVRHIAGTLRPHACAFDIASVLAAA